MRRTVVVSARAQRISLQCAALLVSVLWGCLPSRASGQMVATFTPLGDLPGGGSVVAEFYSDAFAVSGDGRVVVGRSESDRGMEAFRWEENTGMVGLGFLPGGIFSSHPFGVSFHGTVVVGTSYSGHASGQSSEAFRWTASTGMVGLDGPPDGWVLGAARAVSADGTTVVGQTYPPNAFGWEASTGTVALGHLPGGNESASMAVSADGKVIVGWSGLPGDEHEAFRWTVSSGMVGLGILPGGRLSTEATAVSADGSVVVGYGRVANGNHEAFRWTEADGMESLGVLPNGGYNSIALGVSEGGRVVVGWGAIGDDLHAFIWNAPTGMRNLRDVLINDFGLGTQLEGWRLPAATAISHDGRTIVGYGFGPRGVEAWRVQFIPEPSIPVLLGAGLLTMLVLYVRRSRTRR